MEIDKFAEAGLKRAAGWLRSAELALKEDRHDDVVYCSQMCVEQSTKAVLLHFGIDYPKEHDVSQQLLELSKRKLPKWFRDKIPEIARHVSELAKIRGLAGYGFEQAITKDYFKEYSSAAFEAARRIHMDCRRLLESR